MEQSKKARSLENQAISSSCSLKTAFGMYALATWTDTRMVLALWAFCTGAFCYSDRQCQQQRTSGYGLDQGRQDLKLQCRPRVKQANPTTNTTCSAARSDGVFGLSLTPHHGIKGQTDA